MSSLNNIINLMNTDKMTVKTVDKTELTYSNNIIDDLRDINKCKSVEDFDLLEKEYGLQIDLINRNLDYYTKKTTISNNLYSYSKEMYDFYMSTEEANVLEKLKYAFKLFVEKIISLAIKLFRFICIKLAEFRAHLQNGLYKKFDKNNFVYTNIRIKAIPINENMAEIDKFLDDVYKKNYIIGKLFAWQENGSNLEQIETELTTFVEKHLKEVKRWNQELMGIELSAHKYVYLYEKQLSSTGSKPKEDRIMKFTDTFKNSKNEVISIIKTTLYDMHNYFNQVGKYGEYNITVGEYLKCKPKEKPKLLEILGPNFLNKIISMRKNVDGYIKNLNNLIKKHEYEKYFIKEDFEREAFDKDSNETRDKKVKIIHKAINFLYSLNYYLFMELINIRSSVEKAIKIGCNGKENKMLNKISKKPPVKIIETDERNYVINGLTVNDSTKLIKIEGFCDDEKMYNDIHNWYSSIDDLMFQRPGLIDDIPRCFDKFRELFDIKYNNCTLQFTLSNMRIDKNNDFSKMKDRYIKLNITKEVEEVLVDEGAIFYHTSLNKDLKQISPFHKPSMPILFEYPKFFAGYNIPLIRDGSTLFKTKKSKSFLENENYGAKGTRIYQIPTDLVLNDIRTNNARVVIDYDVFGASNSVSIICFKGQSYPVIDITEKYFNQE